MHTAPRHLLLQVSPAQAALHNTLLLPAAIFSVEKMMLQSSCQAAGPVSLGGDW